MPGPRRDPLVVIGSVDVESWSHPSLRNRAQRLNTIKIRFTVDTDFLKAFETATVRVFDTMASIPLIPGSILSAESGACLHEINAIVPILGRYVGSVVIGADREFAMAFTETVLGYRPETIDDDVVDAVKELGNMIVGQVEGNLNGVKLRMSLPTVIIGKGAEIGFGSVVEPYQQTFRGECGSLSLLFGLIDTQAASNMTSPDSTGQVHGAAKLMESV